MGHHANMWAMYEGEKHYIIASNFPEGLFALTKDKVYTPAEEWAWVRCESVELIKTGQVIDLSSKR